jgi:hypothetical protein
VKEGVLGVSLVVLILLVLAFVLVVSVIKIVPRGANSPWSALAATPEP